MKRIAAIGCVVLTVAVAPVTRAQFTANYQTNTISGITSNWTGNGTYVVGSNTFYDALQILNGGTLSDGDGYVGYEVSGSNNAVTVAGSGSTWVNTTNLFIGYSSADNRLMVTNGGSVVAGVFSFTSSFSALGYNGSSSNNIVFVSGTGSTWNVKNGVLKVGLYGPENQLIITNRGRVYTSGALYVGSQTSSCNNQVLVTGIGSISTNNGYVYVGFSGSSNSLVIADGATGCTGIDADLNLGAASSGSNNTMLITGSNSVWIMNVLVLDTVYVGKSGSANSLTISNGGALIGHPVSTSSVGQVEAYVGYISGANSNVVLVTGAGSVWSNINSLFVGFSGSANSLTISNGGAAISGSGVVGNSANASNNAVVITGVGSVWSNNNTLSIGATNCSGNSVTVSDFGVLQSKSILLGPRRGGQGTLTVGESATVLSTNMILGNACTSTGTVTISGGSLFVTNSLGNAVLDVRTGTLSLNSGTLQVDRLVITNSCGHFNRTGGILIYGTAVLTTNLDADGDGMANGWEQAYGLDPLNAADASADKDGDGFTNLQEIQAGTNPTNSSSAFRILGVVATSYDVLVTWATGGGRTNVVQSAPDVAGSYTNISPNIILPGSGDVTTNYLDAGAGTNGVGRFYKIKLVP